MTDDLDDVHALQPMTPPAYTVSSLFLIISEESVAYLTSTVEICNLRQY